ncbi:MAG: phosphate ABC transporter substrate-binding protein [Candidatus Heteroscillospira sp.]|jgi:phosphate transport system substrate-binding protein
MKRTISLLLSSVLCLGLLAGCGGNSAPESEAPSTPSSAPESSAPTQAPAELSGTVNTDGSTSMEKVVKALAEAYMGENKGVTVNYSGTGSGSGIEAVLAGTCDIGLSSRELKDAEVENGAVAHVVALDGVAIVVNPANTVTDLTVEQIADIFSGKVTNWSELGGSDGPIAVLGREAGSGTRGAFEEIVGVADQCVYTNEYSSTGDVIGNVASNPNAIGYASLSSVNDTVSAVKVAGVECTEETVKDGSYAIQRPFVMVTKKDAELSPAAQSFLDYAMSSEVAEYIAIAGAVAP